MLGFKFRVLKLSTPQELQNIAAKTRIVLNLNEEKYLPGPGRWWPSEEKETYSALWKKMPKSKILDSHHSNIIVSVSDDNCVTLRWGSGLTGTWGIRIADHSLEKSKFDYEFINIESNIAIYMSD